MVFSAKDKSSRRLSPKKGLKKVLYHPLTWLAVGLHILLLGVPFDPKPAVVESDLAEEPEAEDIPIDILNLSEISTSAPPPPEAPPTPTEPAPTPPPAAPPPAAAPPAPVAEAAAPPAEPPVEAPVEPVTPEPAPLEPAPLEPEPTPTEPPPPAYDPGQDQQLFIANLGAINLGDYTDTQGLPPANFFREPANAVYFLTGETPVAGARSARWMDKGPDAVLGELQGTYQASGITFNQLDNYGGEALYELVTPDGQAFMYISIARLKGSSLLVIWQGNPLVPAAV